MTIQTNVATHSKVVIITVDGACLGNGQSNARAAAAGILNYHGRRRAVAEFIGESTNQRAEIIAAAVGLEALQQPCTVIIRSDSKYLVQTMNKIFRRRTNLDLWARLDRAAERHKVTYQWVKGHNGDREQEAADKLARATAQLGEINQVLLNEKAHQLENENSITPELRNAISEGLAYLANECDGAKKRDGVGFHKFDTDLGHRLAKKELLTEKDFAVSRDLLRRYHAQLATHNPTIAAMI
jgi:ribonuclease HI